MQTDVEGLSSEPAEGGQHEVMHQKRHRLTAHKAFHLGHRVVDQEGKVEQEQGQHQVDEDNRGLTGFFIPVKAEQ